MTLFLSLNGNTARNYRNEANYLGIFSCQKQLRICKERGLAQTWKDEENSTKRKKDNNIENNVEEWTLY